MEDLENLNDRLLTENDMDFMLLDDEVQDEIMTKA